MAHVIITSANIPQGYENRKMQYIESIEACLKYSHLFNTYCILECVSAHEGYLGQYNTYYSKEGNIYTNKGLNEMNHLRAYLKQSSLPDDEPIIKLSGKYMIEEPYFFEKVMELEKEFDSMFKNDNDVYVGNGYHTFFYYMKKKLFIDVADSLEYSDDNGRPIEWDVKEYLMVNSRHIEIDRLGVMARQGPNSEKIFHC
jgi:hypothetical protein